MSSCSTNTKNTQRKLGHLPDKEILWMTQLTESGTRYFVTSNKDRTKYHLYKEVPDGFKKIKTATTPVGFEEMII